MFIVDTMLGTLAKWLRVFGFDTLYEAGMDDDRILELAISENHIIISRDRELCNRKPDSIFLETTDLDEQLARVLEFYPVEEDKILSRCLECNFLLQTVARDLVKIEAVPEGVHDRYEEFWHCENCDKYFWPGTHFENMRQKASQFI